MVKAGRFHVESDHVQAAIERMPHVLRDVPEIIHVDAPGNGWSRMSEIKVAPSTA